jgi:hypothetical protein
MRIARRLAFVVPALALAAGCSDPPSFVSPVADQALPLDGSLAVELALPAPLPEGGSLVVTLLRGIDSDHVSRLDVSDRFTVVGTEATGELTGADLGPGRNTLYAGNDLDGDGQPDDLASVTFRWDPLRAAACARDITPVVGVNHSDPIYMAGFDNDRHATGVNDPLWARGFVVQNATRKIAVVTLDLIGYFNNEVQTIRADPALASLGFDAIMVTSTHQHEGPDTMGLWGPDQTTSGVDLGYLDFVNAAVVGCLLDAEAALEPASVRFATGSTVGASLPPHPDLVADGRVLEALVIPGELFSPALPEDYVVEGDDGRRITNPSVPALQLRAVEGGDVLATVVNYASHPEALGSDNTLLTSDFPHFMREALEARYGGVAIYVSADLGVLQGPLDVDVIDPETDLPAQRRTFRFAEVMGELLAERAASALDAASWEANPPIEAAASGPFFVEVENPFFRALTSFNIFGRRDPVLIGAGLFVESEVNAVRIGPAQLAFTPNELDPQIGDLYRAQMTGARHRWLVGLANDEIGYQMPAAKFNPSCFECALYILLSDVSNCPIAIELGEDVVDCDTIFQNNLGPGTDALLQGQMAGVLEAIQVPEPAGGLGAAVAGAVLAGLGRRRTRSSQA